MQFGDLVAVIWFLQMYRQQAGDTRHRSVRTVDGHPLTSDQSSVDAAYPFEIEKAIFGDMRDHKAKLVDVAAHQNGRITLRANRVKCGKGIPIGVNFDGV